MNASQHQNKSKKAKKKRKSALYRTSENRTSNMTSDPSEAKSFTQTDEEPSKGNILVEEDSIDTYESQDTLDKVI